MYPVERRREQGKDNAGETKITKSRRRIVADNVFTLFNFLNFLIAALLFGVGPYSNMLFIMIIILNRPTICVRRENKEMRVEPEEVVEDDLMVLESGSQICNDTVIVWGTLEVNESLLTWESDAMVREIGSRLYSGSSVISGKAYVRVVHVGGENYAANLANEVK